MQKKKIISLSTIILLVAVLVVLSMVISSDKTGMLQDADGNLFTAEQVDQAVASGEFKADDFEEITSNYFGTIMSLIPPIVAIVLALVTKEVYSSLFAGILTGALLASNFSFTGTMDTLIKDGLTEAVIGNAGNFVFLVELGILVALVNRSGAAPAFGRWAEKNIKTKIGAILATFVLGVLIFIDDYFNCLTVGSVMAPVTDSKKISRVKLAYLIDATAAPVCMIAPISSWATAVSSAANDCGLSGLELFIKSIPFNFYSLLTLVFIVALAIMGFDYGSMAGFEIKAQKGDLSKLESSEDEAEGKELGGRLIDMIIPIVTLIVVSVIALLYVGGFFEVGGEFRYDFIGAFGNTDATVALPWAGLIALVFSMVYLILRRRITFKAATDMIPHGFFAMVPAILILTFANALKNTTNLLGSSVFVGEIMSNAQSFQAFLPAIIFLVACVIAFSTGTSWGTFGILIPVVVAAFSGNVENELLFIGISACLAGAVCGDHCSPISDTTIMASAGAQCNHVDHVATQLPYAITVAAVSFVSFLISGFVKNWFICFPIALAILFGTLFVIKGIVKKKTNK